MALFFLTSQRKQEKKMYDLKMYKDQEPKMGSKFRDVNGVVVGHIQPVQIPGSVQKWGVKIANEKLKKSEKK